MKTQVTLLGFILIILSSCAINKSLINAANESTEGNGQFIITNEGQKIIGNQVKFFARHRTRGDLSVDGKLYYVKDIAIVQTKDAYYKTFGDHMYVRIHRGKIEAYTFTTITSSSGRMATICYMSKNNGELKEYTTQNLYDLIKDKKSTLILFNETYKSIQNKAPWDFQYKNLSMVLDDYN